MRMIWKNAEILKMTVALVNSTKIQGSVNFTPLCAVSIKAVAVHLLDISQRR